jgi:hypothetical protein
MTTIVTAMKYNIDKYDQSIFSFQTLSLIVFIVGFFTAFGFQICSVAFN